MSLPLQAVDRLFERLTATYGRQFTNLYEGLDAAAIKSLWAHELGGFGANLNAIAWALENLPERAPNVIEFRNLARRAPAAETPRLPDPPPNPQRVREELAKLGGIREEIASRSPVNADWAFRIVARAEAGARVAPLPLRMALEVVERAQRRGRQEEAFHVA